MGAGVAPAPVEPGRTTAHVCRSCGAPLERTFVDLGLSPLANSYVPFAAADEPEVFHPLHAYVCTECLLVQLPAATAPENIFGDYAYFSSYSTSWLEHARRYAIEMSERLGLGGQSSVIEVASNDGYLLQYFKERGIPVLGIEPAANVAEAAEAIGIPTLVEFFGTEMARRLRDEGTQADLLIGNNVLAHVPDLNDFVAGLKLVLGPAGVLTMEFPHLLRLIEETQFDTIYHEHFSYFSLVAVERVFERHGLRLFDVDELPTHGGSLRIHVTHADAERAPSERLIELRAREKAAGLHDVATYEEFGERVDRTKRSVLAFALEARGEGKTIVGYGAAAKGCTLLNYCGLGHDFIDYVVDRSPHKQQHFVPGTRIPIFEPERIDETRPDYVLLLAWNLKDEILKQLEHVREYGTMFVVPVPIAQVC